MCASSRCRSAPQSTVRSGRSEPTGRWCAGSRHPYCARSGLTGRRHRSASRTLPSCPRPSAPSPRRERRPAARWRCCLSPALRRSRAAPRHRSARGLRAAPSRGRCRSRGRTAHPNHPEAREVRRRATASKRCSRRTSQTGTAHRMPAPRPAPAPTVRRRWS